MRLIDADAFCADILNGKPIGLTICQYSESDILHMIKMQPTIVQSPNDPLTMEELREMDGEPVFVRELKDSTRHRWAFVDAGCEVVRYFTTRNGVSCHVIGNYFKTYGKTWLAYRRKQEEGII